MKSGATSPRVSEKDNGLIVSANIRNEVVNEVISDRKKEKKKSSGTNSSKPNSVFLFFFFFRAGAFTFGRKKWEKIGEENTQVTTEMCVVLSQ